MKEIDAIEARML